MYMYKFYISRLYKIYVNIVINTYDIYTYTYIISTCTDTHIYNINIHIHVYIVIYNVYDQYECHIVLELNLCIYYNNNRYTHTRHV